MSTIRQPYIDHLLQIFATYTDDGLTFTVTASSVNPKGVAMILRKGGTTLFVWESFLLKELNLLEDMLRECISPQLFLTRDELIYETGDDNVVILLELLRRAAESVHFMTKNNALPPDQRIGVSHH